LKPGPPMLNYPFMELPLMPLVELMGFPPMVVMVLPVEVPD